MSDFVGRYYTRYSSFRYLLQEASLIVLFILIFLLANTWRALADYSLIRVGVSALTLISSLWLVLRLTRRWVAPAPLSIPLLIFILAYFVAALASIQQRRSLDEVWVFAMYAFSLALVAQLVANGWPREVFTKSLLIAGSLLAAASLWFTFTWYRSWLAIAPGQWIPDIAYRLPLANGQATYLYLLTFIAITRLQVTRALVPRILLLIWLPIAAVLLYLSASRGGWLATVAGLAVIAFIALRDAGGFKFVQDVFARLRRNGPVSVVGGVVALVVLVGLGWLASNQIINPQKAAAAFARVEYWVPAWETFTQRPLLGQGPLTFGSSYLRLNSVPPYGFFAHAHSIFFNLLSETGIVGVAAFGVLAIATFVALWRQVNVLTGHDRAVAIAALAGAAAWAAHSIVDTVNVEPMNSVLMTVLLGAALSGWFPTQTATAEKQASVLVPVRSWWPVALGIVLSITGIYSVWRMTPMYDGLVASTKQEWSQTATSFAEAVNRDGGNPIAHQQAGLAYSVLAQDDPAALNNAIREYETVVAIDPDWWLNHANLAALYSARGDTQMALDEYRLASKIGRGSPTLMLNYGMAAEAVGEAQEAQTAYLSALNLRGSLADSYFWRSNDFRKTVLSEWRSSASSRSVLTVTQMQALATGGDRASDYTPLAAEYIRLGRLDEAEALLKKAKLAYFDTGDAAVEVSWLNAALVAGQGDVLKAAELGKEAIDGYLMQSALGPGTFGWAAYGQVFFRQSTMAADLVPQLAIIPLTDMWAARLVQVGDWYAAAGEREKARAIYERVLSLVPDNAAASERLNQSQ